MGPRNEVLIVLDLRCQLGLEYPSLYKASLSDDNPCTFSCCHYLNLMNPIVLRQGNFLPASHTKVSVGKQAGRCEAQAAGAGWGKEQGGMGRLQEITGREGSVWTKTWEVQVSEVAPVGGGRSAMRSGEGAWNFKTWLKPLFVQHSRNVSFAEQIVVGWGLLTTKGCRMDTCTVLYYHRLPLHRNQS